MKNILLIAGLSESYYFDPFVTACKNKNITVFVFDQSSFPSKSTIYLTMDDAGKLSGFIDVVKYEIGKIEDVRLSITDIAVAWYLRESGRNSTKSELLETRFTENESRATLHSFYSTLDCTWINKKETIDFLTSNKFFQQQIALKNGLMVPNTVISNNPENIQTVSDLKNGLLVKSLGYIRLDEKGEYFLYAERFSREEISANDEAIRGCPIFVQEYIEKRYEYRVMVIGKRILACRIDSQASEKTKTDWRHYDFEHVEHVGVELPDTIKEKLLSFMKGIGLKYGAIDLIETPKGDFVFLEINPSGQWGWIADLASLQIPEAVAEMLESI